MLGAIIGDICGSSYEFNPVRSDDFPLLIDSSTFTDDTILTVAVADALLNNKGDADTQASISGAIAEAFYREIPQYLLDKVEESLPTQFLELLDSFKKRREW
jgi:ADP-ribosyl-[dinitrogen reductase] hydrolase